MQDSTVSIEESAPKRARRPAKFSESIVVRCSSKQIRLLKQIQKINRLDSMSQALRFALDEMVSSYTTKGASHAR